MPSKLNTSTMMSKVSLAILVLLSTGYAVDAGSDTNSFQESSRVQFRRIRGAASSHPKNRTQRRLPKSTFYTPTEARCGLYGS